jgi:hypothetical protein
MTTADLLYSAETEILASIIRSLKGGAVGTAEWQSDRLARLGVISVQSARIVSAYRKQIESGAAQDIQLAAIEAALKSDAQAFKARQAGAQVKVLADAIADPGIKATIAAWQSSAQSQLNIAMAQLAQNSGRVYSDIINKTTFKVLTGAIDANSALRQTIREWSEKGIPSIVDKAGRQWTSEAYVNAVLRSNASRASNEVSLKRAEEYGTDLVEISSHPGCRPTHYRFQGNVYSRSGTSEKYSPLSITGWGTAGGIGGVNCSHGLNPFWIGYSITRKPGETASENELAYDTSQEQRSLERDIRRAKREKALMEELGDDNGIWEAKQSLSDSFAAMRDFTEATGRTRRREREQVYD